MWWDDPVLAGLGPTEDETYLRVASVDPGLDCDFTAQFTVPDVPPGTYPVVVRYYHEGGYGWGVEHDFTVR